MSVLEISEVVISARPKSMVVAAHLDRPHPQLSSNTYSFPLEGWLIAKPSPAIAVELRSNDTLPLRFPINVIRHDLPEADVQPAPGIPSGFRAAVSSLELPQDFDLGLFAVLGDGARIPLGRLRGRRQAVASDYEPKFHPVMITTWGRTGSTWLTALLGAHPSILACRPFQYEARVATYWMDVFASLAAPASYLQAVRGELYGPHWWLGTERRTPQIFDVDPDMEKWLGSRYITDTLVFCQSRIDAFYRWLTEMNGQPESFLFAEKFTPQSRAQRLLGELDSDAREVFLVRDPRDMICSILDFNERRGIQGFGREAVSTDAEYVRWLARPLGRLLETWATRRDSARLLRYEDLLTDTAGSLQGLFAFLGVDHASTTVQAVIDSTRRHTSKAQRRHQTSPSPLESIGRWRHDLPLPLQKVCEESLTDILTALGYAT